MANMDVTQRTQFERADLQVPTTGVRVRSRRGLAIYTLLALPLLAAMIWATIDRIDGWAQIVVLAMIVVTAIGAIIALDPKRRG
jgi:hypothetical protein